MYVVPTNSSWTLDQMDWRQLAIIAILNDKEECYYHTSPPKVFHHDFFKLRSCSLKVRVDTMYDYSKGFTLIN